MREGKKKASQIPHSSNSGVMGEKNPLNTPLPSYSTRKKINKL